MKLHLLCGAALVLSLLPICGAEPQEIPNRLIDYPGFLQDAAKVGELCAAHRLTEEKFNEWRTAPGTVVLDARSAQKYALLHVRRAVNLSLPDITAAELAKIIPDKTTRVLIYCNNNFLNSPQAFASKSERASLNIYTFNTLYSYGYQNVYELGPLIDVQKTVLPMEGSSRPTEG